MKKTEKNAVKNAVNGNFEALELLKQQNHVFNLQGVHCLYMSFKKFFASHKNGEEADYTVYDKPVTLDIEFYQQNDLKYAPVAEDGLPVPTGIPYLFADSWLSQYSDHAKVTWHVSKENDVVRCVNIEFDFLMSSDLCWLRGAVSFIMSDYPCYIKVHVRASEEPAESYPRLSPSDYALIACVKNKYFKEMTDEIEEANKEYLPDDFCKETDTPDGGKAHILKVC